MALTTTNGMTIDGLDAAPNGPGLVQQLGNQIDEWYGKVVANAAALPASGRFSGQRIWLTDVSSHAVWNAAKSTWDGYWKSYTPSITGVPGTTSARWLRVGKLVTYEIVITATGASTTGISASLPTPADASHANTNRGVATAATSAFYTGVIFQNTSTTITAATAGALSQWGNSNPTAWANTNKLTFFGTYIEA